MSLLRQADVDPADDGGVLRKDFNEPFLLKAHQRIADRRRADAELLRQFVARQRRAGWQRQRGNQPPQPFEYLRRRLPITVEPAG
jgi:hypothetical protein